MRWAFGGISVLATTIPVLGQTSPSRPTATYTLVRNDDGTGTPTPKHWAVYADLTSPGYAGIFAWGVDLVDGSVTSIENVSPSGAFVSSSIKPPYRPIGFTGVRSTFLDRAKLSGSQELINANAVIEYGFGLRDGRLETAANRPVDVLGDAGAWTFEEDFQNSYHAHLLLGVGTFDQVLPAFQDGSPDNVMGVFLDSKSRSSQVANMTLLTFDLLPAFGQDGARVPEPGSSSLLALVAAGVLHLRVRRSPNSN